MILILMYFLELNYTTPSAHKKCCFHCFFFMGGDYPNGQYWPLDSILEFPRMCLGSLSYCMESCSLDILGLLGAKVISSFLSPVFKDYGGLPSCSAWASLSYKYSDLKILTLC